MRQPRSPMASADRLADMAMPKAAASMIISPWLATCQLAKKPRRAGSCSASRAVALPNSPPAESPWIIRATVIRIGAAMPIV